MEFTSVPEFHGTATVGSGKDQWISNLSSDSYNTSTEYRGTTDDGGLAIKHTVAGAVFIVLVAIVLMVLTVGGNLLVIIAYKKNRRLRSVNNLFLVSLACSDLVIGIVSMNLYPIVILTQGWPFGEVACEIWLCIDYTMSMASVANLMLICLDRYFSVTRPFTYRSRRTGRKAKIAIVLAWIFSMLLWSPAIVIWPMFNEPDSSSPGCAIQFFVNPVITCITAILAFYLPVLIMIILYWRIYNETRKCRQYMEYLRSYKISQAGARSPFIKRKVSARNSNPVSSKDLGDVSPRRRINSTPATSFRSGAGCIFRPDPLLENPQEQPCNKSLPYSDCNNCRNENGAIKVLGSRTLSIGSSRSAEKVLNNNYEDDKEVPPTLSRFQRLTRSIVGSIRNSLKSNGNDIPREEPMPKSIPDRRRRDTSSTCCDRSHTLSASRRLSAETLSIHSPHDKNDGCVSLLADGKTSSPEHHFKGHSETSPLSFSDRGLVVPVIVTPDDHKEAYPRGPPRRTKSETDGLAPNVSLSVPPSTRERASSRPGSKGEPLGPGRIPASDRKAARTLSAILLAFIVTWLPYNVCVVIHSFCPTCINDPVWDFAYYLCYINSTLNPICYAMCNKTFRNTFIRLLTCNRRHSTPRRIRCCFGRARRSRDRNTDTVTMQPSTSSSRSVPPSPLVKKRGSSST